jgi:hypothetical protein
MTSHAGSPLATVAPMRATTAPASDAAFDAPVTRRDRFAGRRQTLHDLQHVLLTPGRHALVLGEAGIGRSSMLAMVPGCLEGPRRAAVESLAPDDTFASLWSRVSAALGTDGDAGGAEAAASSLRRLATAAPVVVALDDVHRASPELRAQLAALAGALVSPPAAVTLVVAGAGFDAHEVWPQASALGGSVDTFVLARLTGEEGAELADEVLAGQGLDADPAALATLVALSAGRPGDGRRLASAAAAAARRQGAGRVGMTHVHDATREALASTPADVLEMYEHATIRARRGIFPEILWACARAPRGADGSFSTHSVRDTLQRMLKREVRGLTNQISVLAEDTRGQVLIRVSGAPNPHYRFADPRLEPYVLLRGLADRDLPNVAAHDDATESWLREAA